VRELVQAQYHRSRTLHLYSERDLQSLARGLHKLEAQSVRRAYAIFNKCCENFGIMNAATMSAILRDQGQNLP
jgi:uncharacterized protein YecE (DUF72 family)